MLNDFIHLRQSIAVILYQNRKALEHLQIEENEWLKLERYRKIFEVWHFPTILFQGQFIIFRFSSLIN